MFLKKCLKLNTNIIFSNVSVSFRVYVIHKLKNYTGMNLFLLIVQLNLVSQYSTSPSILNQSHINFRQRHLLVFLEKRRMEVFDAENSYLIIVLKDYNTQNVKTTNFQRKCKKCTAGKAAFRENRPPFWILIFDCNQEPLPLATAPSVI